VCVIAIEVVIGLIFGLTLAAGFLPDSERVRRKNGLALIKERPYTSIPGSEKYADLWIGAKIRGEKIDGIFVASFEECFRALKEKHGEGVSRPCIEFWSNWAREEEKKNPGHICGHNGMRLGISYSLKFDYDSFSFFPAKN
jgi:hypothetical protein